MFCNVCGKQLPDGSKFCGACGASLEGVPQAAAPMPEPTVPTPEYNVPTAASSMPAAPSYAAPAYNEPAYSAPAPEYNAPAPEYNAPAPEYNAPAPEYNAPAQPSYVPTTDYSYLYGSSSKSAVPVSGILTILIGIFGLIYAIFWTVSFSDRNGFESLQYIDKIIDQGAWDFIVFLLHMIVCYVFGITSLISGILLLKSPEKSALGSTLSFGIIELILSIWMLITAADQYGSYFGDVVGQNVMEMIIPLIFAVLLFVLGIVKHVVASKN